MSRAHIETELAVRIGNRPGELARLLSAISTEQINILAYCAYSDRDEGVVLLVTEDPRRAQRAVEVAGYPSKTNAVIVVGATDQVGAAATLGARLGQAGVNILYSYASADGSGRFCAVFKTNNDDMAVQILETIALADAA